MYSGIDCGCGKRALPKERCNFRIAAHAVVLDHEHGKPGLQKLHWSSLRPVLAAAPQVVQHGAIFPTAPRLLHEHPNGGGASHDEGSPNQLRCEGRHREFERQAVWCGCQQHDQDAHQQEVFVN